MVAVRYAARIDPIAKPTPMNTVLSEAISSWPCFLSLRAYSTVSDAKQAVKNYSIVSYAVKYMHIIYASVLVATSKLVRAIPNEEIAIIYFLYFTILRSTIRPVTTLKKTGID